MRSAVTGGMQPLSPQQLRPHPPARNQPCALRQKFRWEKGKDFPRSGSSCEPGLKSNSHQKRNAGKKAIVPPPGLGFGEHSCAGPAATELRWSRFCSTGLPRGCFLALGTLERGFVHNGVGASGIALQNQTLGVAAAVDPSIAQWFSFTFSTPCQLSFMRIAWFSSRVGQKRAPVFYFSGIFSLLD